MCHILLHGELYAYLGPIPNMHDFFGFVARSGPYNPSVQYSILTKQHNTTTTTTTSKDIILITALTINKHN
jgi:hypothetical protein